MTNQSRSEKNLNLALYNIENNPAVIIAACAVSVESLYEPTPCRCMIIMNLHHKLQLASFAVSNYSRNVNFPI